MVILVALSHAVAIICHGPGPPPGLTAPCAGGASVPAPAAPHQLPGQPDFRYSGTELVMLYDYKVPCKNFREVSLTPLFTVSVFRPRPRTT